MQYDGALFCLLKGLKETKCWHLLNSISGQCAIVTSEEKRCIADAEADLKQHQNMYGNKYKEYCSTEYAGIQSWLAWSDVQMFCNVITVQATKGQQKLVDEEEIFMSEADLVDTPSENPFLGAKRFIKKFQTPVLSVSADLDSILQGLKLWLVCRHTIRFLVQMNYRSLWWRLLHYPYVEARKNWSNFYFHY